MRGDKGVPPKLTRPRVEQIHPRADLLHLLDELRTAPMIIVSGVAGADKTGLVGSYAQTRNIPSLWYQMDRGDGGLAHFFHHVDLAAHHFISLKKTGLPAPTFECLQGDSSAVRRYFEELYRCMFTPFLMIFDNYHEVAEQTALHGVIRDACAVLPVGGRIVLIAGNDSPPTITCLRANRSAVVIGWQELQMHPAKVKEMAALHGLTLPAEEVTKQLQRKVGNWAAELVTSLAEAGRPLIPR